MERTSNYTAFVSILANGNLIADKQKKFRKDILEARLSITITNRAHPINLIDI
jgi:hypothetical protein